MKNCLRTLLLLLLCSTVAFAGNSAPADETYTLTYVVDGETYQTATLAAGAAINLPEGPAKKGYEFVKWDLETAVPIDIASNADAMLYTNAPCTDTRYGDQFTSWNVLFDGQASTFFHSEYANNESADGLDHYLRVDMGEGKSITNFTFTYTNRNTNSYINAPKTMVVEGSNSADGEYVELATLTNLSSTDSDVYNSQVIGNGTAYRYIRYRVTETHYNQKVYEHPFFFIAEFGMADAVVPTTMPAADFSLVAVYKEPSGTCGENATWSLANGVLTISGTGDMANYSDTGDNTAPWTEYREDITSIVVEEGITNIGTNAFRDSSVATSVSLPSTATSIGDYAFLCCYGLTEITIPNSVTTIGNYAFQGCNNLTSIEIPNSVTSIGEDAFSNCDGLTEIAIPNSVTSIGDYAFQDCSGLTSVTIGNGVTSIGGLAFQACNSLTSIVVDEGNSVYDSREGCNAIIESATNTLIQGCMNTIIPNSVTSIGEDAFSNCDGLTEIAIPNSVTSIESYAFQDCSGLTNVTIGNSVTSIENSAFTGCDSLTSIVVDEENSVYDSREGCNAIIETATNTLIVGCKNTTIPGSVTSIGDYAFSECDGLTEITIPNSVTSIGYYAFQVCNSLTSIEIPNSVTSIGDGAFNYCTALTSVTIPGSITSIGNQTFNYCTALTSVIIPGSVTTIGSNAFQDCNNLENIISLATTPATLGGDVFNGIGENAVLKVPANAKDAYEASEAWSVISTIETLICGTCGENLTWVLNDGVLTIIGTGDMYDYFDFTTAPWYNYNDYISAVVIGNGVTSIGNQAFYNCYNLTNVTIPNSVITIGSEAFYLCGGLTSVTIGNGVTSIGYSAFSDCDGLTEITIPNSVTSIENSAFTGCDSLTSIVVDEENNVYDSREGCNAIIETATNTLIAGCKNTTIPGSVTSIGGYAFLGCDGLTEITIPNSVTSIGYGAFSNCDGLTEITIPNSATSIGGYAFQGCNSLTSIEIPNSVTSIGYGAFDGCSGFTSIVVDEENSVYDSREGCNAIIETATNALIAGCKNTIIPNSVTVINDYAFTGCTGLTSITIPNSVTSIGSDAFRDCTGLTEIIIPNSVTSIEICAFQSCTGLTNVTIGNSVTSIGYYAFRNCEELTDIYFASNPTIDDSEILSTTTCHLTLTDSDAADFNTANANTYADVSYTRTISEGKYGTIMLPFAPDEASLQNYAFYTLKEAGDGYIRFEEVTAPEANTPYLYTLREGGENAAITGGQTTIATDINNCNVDGWELVGSFSNQTIDCTGGNYYAYSAARNEINRITKTLTVRPYRAFLMSTAAQNSNLRVFIGGTTGITEISPDDIEGLGSGAIYDLYGRPVNEPAKGGIYIIDGKKVVW